MRASLGSIEVLVGALAAVGVAVYVYDKRQALANAVNPASSQNVVNQAVTKAGQALTGDSAWTLGGTIYDIINGPSSATAPTPLPKYSPGWCKSMGMTYPCGNGGKW